MIYSDLIFNLLAKWDFLPLVNNQPRVTEDSYWKISSTGILQSNESFDAEVRWKSSWNCSISQQRLFTKLMNLCFRIAHIPPTKSSNALHDIYMFSLLESHLGSDLQLSAAAAACQGHSWVEHGGLTELCSMSKHCLPLHIHYSGAAATLRQLH